jgi:hypothetical protein
MNIDNIPGLKKIIIGLIQDGIHDALVFPHMVGAQIARIPKEAMEAGLEPRTDMAMRIGTLKVRVDA